MPAAAVVVVVVAPVAATTCHQSMPITLHSTEAKTVFAKWGIPSRNVLLNTHPGIVPTGRGSGEG